MRDLFDRTRPGNVAETFRTMLPLLMMAAAGAINAVTDRFFLARFSDTAVGAVVPAGVLVGTLSCFFLATAGYSSTFVAHAFGRGDREGTGRALFHGLVLALVFVPFILLAIPVGHVLLARSGHAAELVAAERAYFDITMPAAILQVFAGVLGGYFNGLGRTSIAGLAGTVGCLVNLALDPLFIFTFDGGVVGAAWASVAGSAATCLCLCSAFIRTARVFAGGHRPAVDTVLLLRIFRTGAPTGIMNLFGAGVFTVFVMATGRLDALSLAVSNIAFGVNKVFYVAVSGLRDGATVLSGQYFGRGDSAAVKRVYASAVLLAVAAAVLVGGGAVALSGEIAGIFRAADSSFDPAAFRSTLTAVLGVMALRMLAEALVEPSVGIAKGIGDTTFAMFARMASGIFVWLPLIWLVSATSATIAGFWLTMPVHLFATAAILFLRFKTIARNASPLSFPISRKSPVF